MKKILKSKKGFTLVELIVSIVVFAIILTSVSTILVRILRFYAQANELAELNTLVDNIANQITSDISRVTLPVPVQDLGKENDVCLTIEETNDIRYTVDALDGVLLKNDSIVYSKPFYKEKSLSFILNAESGAAGVAYILTVRILSDQDGGGEMISRDYAVRPLALNQYGR